MCDSCGSLEGPHHTLPACWFVTRGSAVSFCTGGNRPPLPVTHTRPAGG